MSAFRGIFRQESHQGNVVEDEYFNIEGRLTEQDVEAFARVGAYDCLLSGTTCIWDHYYYGEAIARAVRSVGICAVVAPTLQNEQDIAGPGQHTWEREIIATEAIATAPYSEYEKHGIVAAMGPHATDTVSKALWERIIPFAERENIPLHFHCAQSIEEVARAVEYCEKLGMNGHSGSSGHAASPITSRLQDCGVLDAAVPSRNVVHGIFLSVKGIKQVTGTDAGCCNDTMDVQSELRLLGNASMFSATFSPDMHQSYFNGNNGEHQDDWLSTVNRVWRTRTDSFNKALEFNSSSQLLSTLWSNPGLAHPLLPTGEIAPKRRANMLLVDPNHPGLWPMKDVLRGLAHGSVASAIVGMMVSGSWRGHIGPDFRRAILESTEYQDAVKEATSRLNSFFKTSGSMR